MKRLRILVASSLMAGGSTGAYAQAVTGNDILRACSSRDDLAATGFCAGYVMGGIEGLKWGAAVSIMADQGAGTAALDDKTNSVLGFCSPAEAENGQLVDVFIVAPESDPVNRHQSARTLLWEPLKKVYPC